MRPDTLSRLYDAIRDVPDFPEPGIVFKDITPLLADAGGPPGVARRDPLSASVRVSAALPHHQASRFPDDFVGLSAPNSPFATLTLSCLAPRALIAV